MTSSRPSISVGVWILYVATSLVCFPVGIVLGIMALLHEQDRKPLGITTLILSSMSGIGFCFIALFAAILIPNFMMAKSQSQLAACESNLKNMATAVELYAVDHQGHYPERLPDLLPRYLRLMPQCPAAQKESYVYQVTARDLSGQPRQYELYCQGEWHKTLHVLRDYPRYDSEKGLSLMKG